MPIPTRSTFSSRNGKPSQRARLSVFWRALEHILLGAPFLVRHDVRIGYAHRIEECLAQVDCGAALSQSSRTVQDSRAVFKEAQGDVIARDREQTPLKSGREHIVSAAGRSGGVSVKLLTFTRLAVPPP